MGAYEPSFAYKLMKKYTKTVEWEKTGFHRVDFVNGLEGSGQERWTYDIRGLVAAIEMNGYNSDWAARGCVLAIRENEANGYDQSTLEGFGHVRLELEVFPSGALAGNVH